MVKFMYEVRLAQFEDLSRIEEIYSFARSFMENTGNPNQWGKTNPPVSQLILDIESQRLFVITRDNLIHGVFFFFIGADPTYSEIYNGQWSLARTYGTIHRIAGDGSGGILKTAVSFCRKHIDYLRIDTHHDNQVMQNAIRKCGFRECGIIYIADGTPRIAYDLY